MSKQGKIVLAYIVCAFLTFGWLYNHLPDRKGLDEPPKVVPATLGAIVWPVVVGGTVAIWVTRWP